MPGLLQTLVAIFGCRLRYSTSGVHEKRTTSLLPWRLVSFPGCPTCSEPRSSSCAPRLRAPPCVTHAFRKHICASQPHTRNQAHVHATGTFIARPCINVGFPCVGGSSDCARSGGAHAYRHYKRQDTRITGITSDRTHALCVRACSAFRRDCE